MKLEILTNSRLKEFRRCPRRHYYLYELGIDTQVYSEPLLMGTIVHLLLEDWWNHRLILQHWDELYKRSVIDQENDLDWIAKKKVEAMINGYDVFYRHEDYETIATELEFRIPLVNPDTGRSSRSFCLSGKIDAIARDPQTGALLLIEHKTTTMDISAASPYWQRLYLDEQISTYMHAARQLGYDVRGCIYDVLKKPTLKPKLETPDEKKKYTKGKDGKLRLYKGQRDNDESEDEYYQRIVGEISSNPSKYYARGYVCRTDEEINYFRRDLWNQAKLIIENRKKDLHIKDSEACFKYSRACKFFDLCCKTSSLDDNRWIQKDRIHGELNDQGGQKECNLKI